MSEEPRLTPEAQAALYPRKPISEVPFGPVPSGHRILGRAGTTARRICSPSSSKSSRANQVSEGIIQQDQSPVSRRQGERRQGTVRRGRWMRQRNRRQPKLPRADGDVGRSDATGQSLRAKCPAGDTASATTGRPSVAWQRMGTVLGEAAVHQDRAALRGTGRRRREENQGSE